MRLAGTRGFLTRTRNVRLDSVTAGCLECSTEQRVQLIGQRTDLLARLLLFRF